VLPGRVRVTASAVGRSLRSAGSGCKGTQHLDAAAIGISKRAHLAHERGAVGRSNPSIVLQVLVIALLVALVGGGFILLGLVAWGFLARAERSKGLGRIFWKGIGTAALLLFMAAVLWAVGRGGGGGGYLGAFGQVVLMVGLVAASGLVVAIFWGRDIAALFALPFSNLYDGGSQEDEARPVYSMAEARRKQGRYQEAIELIQAQLAQFPKDFTGRMMLAEILVDNLNDLPAAQAVLEEYLAVGHPSDNQIAFALNRLADWHLKYRRDVSAARALLERLLASVTSSTYAHAARQRLAHLSEVGQQAVKDRDPLPVPMADRRLGLHGGKLPGLRPQDSPLQLASQLVRQLVERPDDNEAREQLAVLYAEQLHRLDLAEQQLDQLAAQTGAPDKEVVRWLNLKADLQVRCSADVRAATLTLQRIIEMFPETAVAENARRRQQFLVVEAKAKKESQVIRLGSTEKDRGAPAGG